MADLEKMQKAKKYMALLAGGIDPISKTELPQDSVLNSQALSNCFLYVANILQEVIENGGEVSRKASVSQKGLPPLKLTDEQRRSIVMPEYEQAFVKNMAEVVNAVVDFEHMKKLKATAFGQWLLEKEFLREDIVNGKARKKPTQKGLDLGIGQEWRESVNGGYYATFYNRNAQVYIFEHLDEIIAISNGEEPK